MGGVGRAWRGRSWFWRGGGVWEVGKAGCVVLGDRGADEGGWFGVGGWWCLGGLLDSFFYKLFIPGSILFLKIPLG